jgi:raffinose/stachyose/melibiose transport system permease protein
MASTVGTTETTPYAPVTQGEVSKVWERRAIYPYWFYLPAAIIFLIFFLTPMIVSFYFSFTRWDLFTSTWIGLDNYVLFFNEQALIIGLRNTLIYATTTSGLKVVLGMLLAVLLTSKIIAAAT